MINITNEDNMQLMARYEDKHFDLAIVDPPYGLERFKANDGGNSKKIKSFGDKDKNWNNIKPSKEYWEQLFRVSKKQIVWGGNNFTEFLPPSEYFIIWDKQQAMPSFARCEMAWTNCKIPAKIYAERSQDLNRIHPTQKPVKLYEWLLLNYAKEGDKILDTHGGSLSIALAVHNVNTQNKMNLTLDVCELDKDYYLAGKERLRKHQQQLTMF
jgi:site-specific DNA-methyltransferase (adenine-specific)